MKIFKLTLIAFLAIISVGSLDAQELKFGHVNRQEILTLMPELKAVEQQLEAEYTKLENQLGVMREELQSMDLELKNSVNTLTQEQLIAKQGELYEANQKVQQFYTQAQQSIQKKQQELRMPVFEKLNKAIEAVGMEGGFIYIFELASGLPIYHSAKSIDVGNLVKAKLGIQ